MTHELVHVCVVGAGAMGRGIAQIAISAGHEVSLVDPDDAQLRAASAELLTRLSRKHEDAEQILNRRFNTAASIVRTPAHPHTVVIEAVVENLDVKRLVLRQAAEHFGAGCILATNTSSLSITEIAAGSADPSRVVGMHFFNPVPVMRLVEVVAGLQTDAAVMKAVSELATSWGKEVAHVQSAPGFIVNRVARSFYGESLRLLEERAASTDTIDEILRSSGQFRMGPFELMDLIGTEVNLAVTRTVWSSFNYDPRFAPSHIQSELVAAGRFGRKSGHGFYDYSSGVDRPSPEPAHSTASWPHGVVLHGSGGQLEDILVRAGVSATRGDAALAPSVDIPELGVVVVTRGRTAREEAALRRQPVLVLDRCIDLRETTALAMAATDDRLAAAVVALLGRAGIRAYPIADTPGLVTARVLSMIANEAWEAAYHGVAKPEDIDLAMVLGANYPCGPFEWSELWSYESVLDILDTLWSAYRDPRYRASQGLRATVAG